MNNLNIPDNRILKRGKSPRNGVTVEVITVNEYDNWVEVYRNDLQRKTENYCKSKYRRH